MKKVKDDVSINGNELINYLKNEKHNANEQAVIDKVIKKIKAMMNIYYNFKL